MLNSITLTGKYTGCSEKGIVVGGVLAYPNKLISVEVNEKTFQHLQEGVINGWFEIVKHNYDEYCKSRSRKTNKYENHPPEKLIEKEIETKEEVNETIEETKPKKTKKKTVKKTETNEVSDEIAVNKEQ